MVRVDLQRQERVAHLGLDGVDQPQRLARCQRRRLQRRRQGRPGWTRRSTGDWFVSLSTGSSFTFTKWTSWGKYAWLDVNVADVNGDGFSDISGRDLASGIWVTNISNGSSAFTITRPLLAQSPIWSPKNFYWTEVRFEDVDGDGKADIYLRNQEYIAVGLSQMTGINGGFAAPACGRRCRRQMSTCRSPGHSWAGWGQRQ